MGEKKDVESLEALLPRPSTSARRQLEGGHRDFLFKAYVIVSMTIIWTAYTLTVRYTRSTIPIDQRYSSTTVVLLSELVKLTISLCFLLQSQAFNLFDTRKLIQEEFIRKPMELAKMSVPSIAYALQNNLDFVALSNLDAGVYQVTTQLKVVTTAIFMVLFLSRQFSTRRWSAIVLLFAGVAAVQMNAVEEGSLEEEKKNGENYALGLAAVLSTCVTAGFAGVYFEKMLKDGTSTPFWIRNLQMYSCGLVSAMFACFISQSDSVMQRGFFYGYDIRVWSIVGFLSVGGIYISLVMKHLDNLHKSFASAISIILVSLVSVIIFDHVHIGVFFILGSATVIFSVLLYNSVAD